MYRTTDLARARADWQSNLVYYDGQGNFRWTRHRSKALPAGMRHGRIVPWNRAIKRAGGIDALTTIAGGKGTLCTPPQT